MLAYSEYDIPPGRSFMSTVRQLPVIALGLTQASSVIPDVRSSEAESGMLTKRLVPNDSDLPNFPVVLHVAPLIVPLLPFPEASPTTVPVPSLNEYAATSPLVAPPGLPIATRQTQIATPATTRTFFRRPLGALSISARRCKCKCSSPRTSPSWSCEPGPRLGDDHTRARAALLR